MIINRLNRGINKRIIFIFLLITLILSINLIFSNTHFISAQSDAPGVSEIPGAKVSGSLGEIDPNTGLPKKFSEFREKADEFKSKEQNKSYLKKEWTKILADNKFFGPFLFYTDKFFSFFNPFWKITFGIDFSWSLIFLFHIFLWITMVVIIYFPAKAMFDNKLFALITGFIVASVSGTFGIITFFANILNVVLVKLLAFTLFVIIIIVILILYAKLFKGFEEESEEEELERAKKTIITTGKAVEKGMKGI